MPGQRNGRAILSSRDFCAVRSRRAKAPPSRLRTPSRLAKLTGDSANCLRAVAVYLKFLADGRFRPLQWSVNGYGLLPTSGHSLCSRDRNAWSAGMVVRMS